MSAKIHIAGFPVRIGSLKRQRCAWCDAILLDYDLSLIAVAPGGDTAEPRHWEMGSLVAVDGPGSWIVKHEDGSSIPAGWCGDTRPALRLVETEK